MTLEDLSKKGLRQTSAREKLLHLFSEDRAWTAGQLVKEIRGVDRATVFRNLNALQKKGVITSLHSHHGEGLFELSGRSHHAHQFCSNCGKVECVPCPIKTQKNHNLEFFNLCKVCTK
ncbi:MAG: transcriptional repressor [Patescibacteria group bacterium]|jgi:Fur family ferric uptake transcriptional regulator